MTSAGLHTPFTSLSYTSGLSLSLLHWISVAPAILYNCESSEKRLRTIVLVGRISSGAEWRRGLYVRRGTVHSLREGRPSITVFIASEGWKSDLKLQGMRLPKLLLHHPRLEPRTSVEQEPPRKPLLTLLPNISLHPDYAIHEHAILRLPTTPTTQQRRRAPDTTPPEYSEARSRKRHRMGVRIAQ